MHFEKFSFLAVLGISFLMIAGGCSSSKSTAKSSKTLSTAELPQATRQTQDLSSAQRAALNKLMSDKSAQLVSACGASVEKVTDTDGLTLLKIVLSDPGLPADPNVTGYNSATKNLVTCIAHNLTGPFAKANITIDGHTDNVGPYDENKSISLRRAQAVGNLMIREGVSESRITMRGLSYDYPIGDNHLIEGRAMNRRVEIFIMASEDMLSESSVQ